ncbi:unnamed protein product [Hymenolepis diminuta]|uniref:glucose-6-phosphatase n=1 Tax=Hymenolepis diminuta TaxID=6216 RepID=A0A0R3SK72_HYMDI|nr:unnamed protein product [Hymenolepis diminuta]
MVYQYGALFVELLQRTKISPQIFLLASHFADPPAVNLIAFPVAFFLHPVLGSATLLSINFSEWLNCVLKWYTLEPYWWVHTSEKAYIKLKQFPLTCETGPGSPSGHCMVMVSGWLPLLLYIRSNYNRLGSVFLALFITCTVLVAVSRIYIATHFPHQTILGVVAGALIGLFFYEWSLSFYKRSSKSGKKMANFHSSILNSPSSLVNTGVLSLIAGKAVGILLNYLGTDVERSYRLAAKYCARPEWLHPSTSVMASYARVAGALIGKPLFTLYIDTEF